jgi:hypothetical protein
MVNMRTTLYAAKDNGSHKEVSRFNSGAHETWLALFPLFILLDGDAVDAEVTALVCCPIAVCNITGGLTVCQQDRAKVGEIRP